MKLRHSETTWTDESGRSVTFSYLEAENSEAPFVLLPANLEPEDLLSLELLHNLVNRCGLPPDDFHLDREASLD